MVTLYDVVSVAFFLTLAFFWLRERQLREQHELRMTELQEQRESRMAAMQEQHEQRMAILQEQETATEIEQKKQLEFLIASRSQSPPTATAS